MSRAAPKKTVEKIVPFGDPPIFQTQIKRDIFSKHKEPFAKLRTLFFELKTKFL